jgi:hypothetical protein
MKWKGHQLMWETKNYTSTVRKEEVNKFLRDMEQNPQIALGVMVSLHTGIAGHLTASGFDLEELRDGRICLYISNFSKHEDSLAVLQGLQPFLEMFLKRRMSERPKTEHEEESLQTLETRLGRIEANRAILQRLIQNHIDVMRKYKASVMNAKKKSDAIWADVLAGVKDAEHGVSLILSTLLDDEKQVEEIELAPFLFKHTDIAMYDEKQRAFIETTLALFEIGEEYKVTAKEVKEAYKTRGYSEGVVDGFRGTVLLEAAWEKGKKDVRGMRVRG